MTLLSTTVNRSALMKRFSSLLTSQSTLHCRSHSPQSCSDAVDVRCSLGNQPHSCDDEHKPSVRSNCQVLCPRTHPPVDWRDQESNPQPYNLWATQFTTKLPNFLLLFFFFFTSDLQDSSSTKSVFCIDDAVIRPSPHREVRRGFTGKTSHGHCLWH